MDLDDIFKASRAFSTHLHSTHEAERDFHSAMATAHENALAKATGSEAAFHRTAVASHRRMVAHHSAQLAECEKTISTTDQGKLAAALGLSSMSATAPANPARPSWQIEGPRFTWPAPDKPNVPAEFEHLVKSE
ncbi:MAG TPA: hypothetical protein VEJ47_21055 [Candidatus Eremiobacteraceae bacterium]|nr:hypothetical protein [Candidatus Eremiobacteraceae bacterium]